MKVVLVCLAAALLSASAKPPSGLQLFRKKGHDGLSCSRCHSPDGIEISAFGFSRSDVVRRATTHLGKADAKLLANYFKKSPFAQTALKPDSERPLQPGGRLLPGATPVLRDEAFGKELEILVPELTGPPIRTQAEALRARDRLLAIDPRKVQIGIPFNHLSEDGYHGKQHATVADWIPDVGLDLSPKLLRLEDDYLKSPSDGTLAALEAEAANMLPMSLLQQLAIGKFRALLLLQHAIRMGGPSAARLDRIKIVGPGNPFWDVAEVAHQNSLGDPKLLSIPPDMLKKKSGVPLKVQMLELRLPWYWTGWTLDPSLTHTGVGISHTVSRGDYLTQFLWDDGPYPLHMAFMLSKKLIEAGFSPNVPKSGVPQHYEIQFANFFTEGRLSAKNGTWQAERPSVIRVAANAFRLSLLILESDIEKTHACIRPTAQHSQIAVIRQFFETEVRDARDLALCDRVSEELKTAHPDLN